MVKLKHGNDKMRKKLDHLILISKIRARLMQKVYERRAKKAAEAYGDAGGGPNDVTGEIEVQEGESDENEVFDFQDLQLSTSMNTPSITEEDKWPQKLDFLNELHGRIGLPPIDHSLREFEPLTNDLLIEEKQESLQLELEAAKQEAETLRASVQKMEHCIRLAALHSEQRSIKLEKQKDYEVAQVKIELSRVREQLEFERLWSAFLQGGPTSCRSSTSSDPFVDEYQDNGVIEQLRSSLNMVHRGRNREDCRLNGSLNHGSFVRRTSYTHGSPQQKAATIVAQSHDVNEDDVEEDGGV